MDDRPSDAASPKLDVTVHLDTHAAAVTNSSHCSTTVLVSSELLWAASSHGVVDLVARSDDGLPRVVRALRSDARAGDDAAITALTAIDGEAEGALACGYADGGVTTWRCREGVWTERALGTAPDAGSVAALGGARSRDGTTLIVAAAPRGANAYRYGERDDGTTTERAFLSCGATAEARVVRDGNGFVVVLGTARPRGNRVLVYAVDDDDDRATSLSDAVVACGALSGHEDWVTCSAWWRPSSWNDGGGGGDRLLATGSHDAKIRLWRFRDVTDATTATTTRDDDDDEDVVGEARLVLRDSRRDDAPRTAVSLEAVLVGHEEAVTSVGFDRRSAVAENLTVVSSSMDKSVLVWSSSDDDGVWIPVTRVGVAGGHLGGSVGSSLLGFLDATYWGPNDDRLLAVGYGGAVYHWERDGDDDGAWRARPGLTGHFRGVRDAAWEPTTGRWLLTVSSDQTCRLWADQERNGAGTNAKRRGHWRELGRPQVHGYDLNAVACVGGDDKENEGGEPFARFVSGADEKQLRAFDAPSATLRLLGVDDGSKNGESRRRPRVERAYLPSLGLSNKGDGGGEEDHVATETGGPPLERDLGVSTMWPEVRKLYGHDSELVCLAACTDCHPRRTIVASACKARDVNNATIRLWNVEEGVCVDELKGGHRSTVATLAFSPGGDYLASSGKDRRLCVWKRDEDPASSKYGLVAAADSAHKRIVWSVHFCPFDRSLLASGARDGVVKLWNVGNVDDDDDGEVALTRIDSFEPRSVNSTKAKTQPVTAVAFAPVAVGGRAVLAIGLESGLMELWTVRPLPCSATESRAAPLLRAFDPSDCHVATVTRLAWRPVAATENDDATELTLASCGMDHGVRFFDVVFR